MGVKNNFTDEGSLWTSFCFDNVGIITGGNFAKFQTLRKLEELHQSFILF